MTLLEGRRDQYPENMIGKSYYRGDTGCPGGCDNSLNCPLPVCVEDMTNHSEFVVTRNARICALRSDGCDLLTLTMHFDLSDRHIYRILQMGGGTR